MYNLLIADDNIDFSKSLINVLMKQLPNVRLLSLSTDGKETLDLLFNNSIDLLILDLDMPKLNGIEILENLEKSSNIPNIIVISGNLDMLNSVKSNTIINKCIYKGTDFNYIVSIIVDTVNELDLTTHYKLIKNKIIDELKFLGFNFKHKGTIYLLDTIYFIMTNEYSYNVSNLEKNIYSKIAMQHSTNSLNIKHNIFKAIQSMYIENNSEKIQKYFAFGTDIKPNAKLLINTIIKKIEAGL